MRLHFLLTLAAVVGCRDADGHVPKSDDDRRQNPEVQRVGSVVGLNSPEAVRYDPAQDAWFISNIFGFGSDKDGRGFIVRIPATQLDSGKIFAISGKNGVVLDAPKGMAIQGDTLWVTDIDKVRGFHRLTGTPVATIDLAAHGITMLNDIALGPDGTLHVTDTGILMTEKGTLRPGGDKIFSIGAGRVARVVNAGPSLGEPNGITWDASARRWVVVGFKKFNAAVHGYDSTFMQQTKIAESTGQFDGVEVTPAGAILYTAWNDSSLHAVIDGKDERLIRFVPEGADIGYDPTRGVVAIPLVMMDQVEFFALPDRVTGAKAKPASRPR